MSDDSTTTLPELSDKDVAAAQKEGVKAAIVEAAKQEYSLSNNVPVGLPDSVIVPTNDALPLVDMLEMDPDDLKKELSGKGDRKPIPTQGQIASLLEMECSGKNRHDIIAVLCDVLGIKSPREVTAAGPGYANVVSRKAYADVKGA